MLGKQLQAVVHPLDHGSRCDGGAGEAVELTAILLHMPPLFIGLLQGEAVEAEDPVALGGFNLVTQPRRFGMADDTYTGQGSCGIDAEQQVDLPTISGGGGSGKKEENSWHGRTTASADHDARTVPYLPPFINFNPLPTQYPAHAAEKLPSHGNP